MDSSRTRIFIGYDPREVAAYRVCIETLKRHTREGFEVHPINSRLLGACYRRPETRRGSVLWDEVSGAPMSTEFSNARFFTPLVARSGWALYCDCDFMFRADVREVFALADPRYAVMCVKHQHDAVEGSEKMDGQVQTAYPRKNWSSLILWNCDHPHVRSLCPEFLNDAPGRDLHAFRMLEDSDIGALPVEWNWLCGVSDPAVVPKAVHFTLGTPDMKGYESQPYADEWRRYAAN